jgi:hypothetical protein
LDPRPPGGDPEAILFVQGKQIEGCLNAGVEATSVFCFFGLEEGN